MKSDMQIKKDIQDELVWDPAVNATDVGVIVKDGVVTLTGHLATFAEKHAAERAAQRVSGVKAVAVEIDVRLSSSNTRGDADIAVAVNHALAWNVAIPNESIQTKVEKGWVNLSGEVEWDFQRRAAERAVRDLVGVTGVTNLVKVRPPVSHADIQQSIEGALTRQAEREARHLQVIVDGSRVTLKGKVHSWAERRAAQGAAWSAPGVTQVTNELVLSA